MIKNLISFILISLVYIAPVSSQQLWDETLRVPFIRENFQNYYSCDVPETYIVWNRSKKRYYCMKNYGFLGNNENLGEIKKMSLNSIMETHYKNETCRNKKAVGFIPETTRSTNVDRTEENTAWIMIKCDEM